MHPNKKARQVTGKMARRIRAIWKFKAICQADQEEVRNVREVSYFEEREAEVDQGAAPRKGSLEASGR